MLSPESSNPPEAPDRPGARSRLFRWLTRVSLRTKLLGMVLGLVLLTGLAVTLTVRARLAADLTYSLEERGLAITRDLAARSADLVLTDNTFGLYQLIRDTLENNPDVRYVFVVDAAGQPLVHSFPQSVPPDLLSLNSLGAAEPERLQRLDSDEGLLIDVAVPILGGRAGVAHVGLSEARLEAAVARITWELLGITALALLLGTGIALYLTHLLTSPVLELVEVTRRVGEGDLAARARPWMVDEIGELTLAFNRMAGSLQVSHADLLRRLGELATLNAIAAASSSALGLEEMLQAVLVKVREAMDLQAGWVFLEDPTQTARLRLAAWSGLSEAFAAEEASRALGECICARVLQTGQSWVVHDICQECRRLSPEVVAAEGLACHASVPLVSRDRRVGVLNVASRAARPFSAHDLALLDSIGRQIGVASENARLWEAVKEKDALRGQLLERMIGAQEAERQRLARELHDEAGQVLTSLSLGLRTLQESPGLTADQRAQAQDLKALSTHLMTELHRLAVELRPSALDRVGLVAALQQYTHEFQQRYGLEAEFEAAGPLPAELAPELEIHLYRMAQEALTNVARHAQARHVAVILQVREGILFVTIEDDGQGFDPTQVEPGRLGLFGLQERATLLGGSCSVESAPGRGTTVFIRVPVRYAGDHLATIPLTVERAEVDLVRPAY